MALLIICCYMDILETYFPPELFRQNIFCLALLMALKWIATPMQNIFEGWGLLSNSKFKIQNSKWGKSLRAKVSAFGSMQFKCATAYCSAPKPETLTAIAIDARQQQIDEMVRVFENQTRCVR